jgi:cobalt-zinc-cadmium efflux system outer membrane protein
MLTTLRRRFLLPCLGLTALLLAIDAAAQAPVGSLTMQVAIERAMAANPTIAAARLRGPINLANLAVARERLNPEGSFELEKETPKEAYGVAVPLELGGKRARRIEVAEATIRAGDAEVAATIAQVRNDVRRAYFGQIVAEQRLMILREQRDISMRTVDTAQARLDAGDVPRLEVMQAQLALAAAENEGVAAEGTAAAARATLNALLAQPLDTATVLSTTIDDTAPPAAPAALALAQTASAELIALDRQIEAQ